MPTSAHSVSPGLARVTARKAPAAFGAIGRAKGDDLRTSPDFVAIADSADFLELRTRLRRFTFSMSAVFLLWYLSYVVAAAYLHDFMAIRLVGEVNVGLVLGVGQFVSTILITAAYLRFSRREIDPRVAEIRADVLGGDRR